jgi:ribosomal-protein-serine acetyltransferase
MTPIENPAELDISTRFETERMVLVAHDLSTAQAMNDAVRESHKELSAWMPWAKNVQTIEQTRAHIRQMMADFILGKTFAYSLTDKATGAYMGNVGVHPRDWSVPSFEIGYWINTRFAGQGYTSEAVRLLTDYFVETVGAKRMLIRCDTRNRASAGVARKCGYTLEGVQHNYGRDNNGDLMHMEHHALIPDA